MGKKAISLFVVITVVFFALSAIALTVSDANLVYVSNSGERYHIKNTCRGLNAAVKISDVTKTAAIEMGRTPCKWCYPDGDILLPMLVLTLQAPPMPEKSDLLEVICVKVIDGDTAWFEDVDEFVVHKVRFIGVDTPETVHPTKAVMYFGKEASNFTKAALKDKVVYLEYDIEQFDKYARHLCYVWMDDGTLFNLTLIAQGYAMLMTYPPNIKYVDYFVAAQTQARECGLGLWAQ